MVLTLILELPNTTDAQDSIESGVWIADRHLEERVIHVIPLTGRSAPSRIDDIEVAEPTWEDAEWQ